VKKRLVAKIDPENRASERVVQKGSVVDGGYARGRIGEEDKKEQIWWILECPALNETQFTPEI
jgi:hypothetical protein